MIYVALAIILSYLLGSIPTAYIFGKVLKKIDIRKYGSGNVGATNVFRVVGKLPGIIVLILDFLKGMVAVTIIPNILKEFMPDLSPVYGYIYIILGAAVIAGHIWTCFLGFKGGKGVATTGGVMAGVAPVVLLLALLVWIIVFSIWKYVSLASIFAAISLPIFALILGKNLDFLLFCSILCLVGVVSHRGNIKRLIQGNEKRLVRAKNS